MYKCKCGCGNKVNKGKTYISGHNKSMLGKKHSEETLEKMRLAKIGKKASQKTKEKMSESHKGKHKYWLGKKNLKIKGTGNGMYGKKQTLKHTIATRKMLKERWGNKETKQKIIKKWMSSSSKTIPNKPEKLLLALLNKLFPKQYEFVGNGKLFIEAFIPDFVNIKKKKVIEHFGDYWHSTTKAKKKDKFRLKVYKRNGYDTLIIWEKELKNIKNVIQKIKKFNKR